MARATSSLTDRVLAFARQHGQPIGSAEPKANTVPPAARFIGFSLFGALWSILALLCNGLQLVGIAAALAGQGRITGTAFLLLVALSPLAGWLMLMVAGGMTSQAAIGWMLAVRALDPTFQHEALAFNSGSARHPVLLPVRQTRVSAWLTLADKLGWTPPLPLLGAAMLVYLALLIVATRFGGLATGSFGQAASYALLVGCVVGSGWLALRGVSKALRPVKRGWVNDEKYRAGVASRARTRANKLARARAAGQAEGSQLGPPPTPFDAWIQAEVDHELRSLGPGVLAIRAGDEEAIQRAVDATARATLGRSTPERLRELVTQGVILKRKRKQAVDAPVPDPGKPQPPKPRRRPG